MELPLVNGNQFEMRNGMINVAPIGRGVSIEEWL